jgi:hypothetical protein
MLPVATKLLLTTADVAAMTWLRFLGSAPTSGSKAR